MELWDVIVVGAGPGGLMAATRAAERGRRTLLLEKNGKPGAKILLSGGTRCNLTHATDARGIVAAFGPSGRFLHSALAALGPQQVVDLFEAEGVPTTVENGGKVFPQSDRAGDVLAALLGRLQRSGCTLVLGEPLVELARAEGGFRLTTAVRTLAAEKVVLATGGRSYPACGTTGDGYRWAAALGHTVVTPHTALVPITTHASWVTALQGITVADALVKVVEAEGDSPGPTFGRCPVGQKLGQSPVMPEGDSPIFVGRKSGQSPAEGRCLAEQRGSVLFAHFGLSGPAVLDVSRAVSGHDRPQELVLLCDFLPAMGEEELDALLRDECCRAGKRQVASILSRLMPQRLAEALLQLTAVAPDRRAAEFATAERRRVAHTLKHAVIPVAGTMGFKKAEVTAGGVSLDEVDSRTVQSRLVPHLYFAGELLDLDGPVGGYNFQAAFSTGWLAGESV